MKTVGGKGDVKYAEEGGKLRGTVSERKGRGTSGGVTHRGRQKRGARVVSETRGKT